MASATFKNDGDLITTNTTDMNLNAGDVDSTRTVALDAGDNTIEMGGAVKFDGSGNITHTTATGDDVIGVVVPESDNKGTSIYSVNVFGYVFGAQLDDQGSTDVSPGDVLIPSGDYDGAFTGASSGMSQSVDEGGTATYDLHVNHPVALEAGVGAADGGDLDGDVILAFYR